MKHWPAFHPKHCPELVAAFDIRNKGFQYFDKGTRSWFNGSWDGPSRNVKTCGPLRYRTQGVTRGLQMPSSSNPLKRRLDEPVDSVDDAARCACGRFPAHVPLLAHILCPQHRSFYPFSLLRHSDSWRIKPCPVPPPGNIYSVNLPQLIVCDVRGHSTKPSVLRAVFPSFLRIRDTVQGAITVVIPHPFSGVICPV